MELVVDFAVDICTTDANLTSTPAHWSRDSVSVERLFLICMGEIQELPPVHIGQLLLCGNRRAPLTRLGANLKHNTQGGYFTFG